MDDLTDLAELLRRGDLFSVEPADPAIGDFTVSYADVVAHERADLVERSAVALAAVAGVERAVHEDRELVLVRAPSLSARDLERHLHGWWQEAITVAPAWKEDLDAVAAAVGGALEAHRFRKRGALFDRETEAGLLHVVALEHWRHDETGEERVDVSPGVWLEEADRVLGGSGPPGRISGVSCHVRLRGGPLFDHPRLGWPLGAGGAREVVTFATDEVVPLLDRLGSRAGLLAEWEQWGGRIGMGGEDVARAAVLVGRGDLDRAGSVLQEAFERSRPAQRPRLHDVARQLGLPALETGSRPDRSLAEDAFLDQWSSLPEESRLEDVRSFVRALGGPARKLDGSVRSLGPLWEWMADAVRRLQETGPDGPLPAPSGLCRGAEHLSEANRLLAENVAVYLGVVLRRRFPESRWDLDDAGHGLALAVSGVPAGVARVVDRTCDAVNRVVVHPQAAAARRRGLRRRANPLGELFERWSSP